MINEIALILSHDIYFIVICLFVGVTTIFATAVGNEKNSPLLSYFPFIAFSIFVVSTILVVTMQPDENHINEFSKSIKTNDIKQCFYDKINDYLEEDALSYNILGKIKRDCEMHIATKPKN